MCGIAGIVGGDPRDRRPALERMLEAVRHRGPDAEGLWQDDVCSLGHRRLSILDLSDAGRQPMSNEDSSVWLSFNGEIYNYPDLRRQLEAAGHRFRSQTDSEAVIHGYEEWGAEVVTRLRGMFAFGIWDQRRRRLVLARDRIGKKPLLYSLQGRTILFASELHAILASGRVGRDVDSAAVDAYFSLGYIPAPMTAFCAIRKLPPAHVLEYDTSADSVSEPTLRRYWTLSHATKLRMSEDDAVLALREKVTEAVRIRLASDVPIGAFLSGGIDSSIVVGVMARLSATPVRTFTIGFSDEKYDERALARGVAQRHLTDHEELLVESNAVEVLPTLVEHIGEPFGDSSVIPTYYVAQMTRRHVTVALSGDGGDESFAGYERYRGHRLASAFERLPGGQRLARSLATVLAAGGESRSPVARGKRFVSGLGDQAPVRYARWIGTSAGTIHWDQRRQLYAPDFFSALDRAEDDSWLAAAFRDAEGLDPVDAAMAVDIATYLPGDLLVKADIATMANSLETRSPLLDHEVMELAAGLAPELKLRGRVSKHLLKRAFADLLSPEILSQPKRGFGVPVSVWCRGPLRPMVEEHLLPRTSATYAYLDHGAASALVRAHLDGQADHGRFVWLLLMFERWHRCLVSPRA